MRFQVVSGPARRLHLGELADCVDDPAPHGGAVVILLGEKLIGALRFQKSRQELAYEAERRYLLGEPTFPSMCGTSKDAPEVDIVAKPVAGQTTRCITASARRLICTVSPVRKPASCVVSRSAYRNFGMFKLGQPDARII